MKPYEILNEQNCQETRVVNGIKKRPMDGKSVADGLCNKKPKVFVNNVKNQPITCPKEPCNAFLKLMVTKRIQLQKKKNNNNPGRIQFQKKKNNNNPERIQLQKKNNNNPKRTRPSSIEEQEDSSSDEESLSLKQLKHNCEQTRNNKTQTIRKRKKSEEDEWTTLGAPYTSLVYVS